MNSMVNIPAVNFSHASLLSILDGLEAIVYVTDMQTNQVLFANRYVRDVLGDVTGKTCWQAIQVGQDGPCAFCTNRFLLDERGEPKGVHAWEFQNTRNKHWYAIRDRAVRWVDGRIVRLEIAFDITERKAGEKQLQDAVRAGKRFSADLKALHRLTLASYNRIEESFEDYLATGCGIFGLDTAILSRFEGDDYVVVAAISSGNAVSAGDSFPISRTYCSLVRESGATVAFGSESITPQIKAHPAFAAFPATAYIAAPVYMDREMVGTLNFSAARSDRRDFDAHEREVIEIMAQVIGSLLEKERASSQRRDMTQAIQREKELAQVTLGSIGDAVIRTDSQGRVDYLNPTAERMLHVSAAQAIGAPIGSLVNWPRSAASDDPLTLVRNVSSQGKRIDLPEPVVLLAPDDTRGAVEISATPFSTQDGAGCGVVLVLRDVSQTRRLAIQLSHQAAHDPLTGLVNRREFDRRLADVCESAGGRDSTHALLFIDLDRFKVVNDTCGHGAGDELLKQLASLLQKRMRQSDTLARLGGDEFGVLLCGCALADAVNIAGDLQRAIDSYRFAWDGRQFAVGSSIGVVPFDARGGMPEELLSSADRACYAAKERGGNRVYVYQSNDASLAKRSGEVRWVAKLPDALDAGRFRLLAQAIVPLSSAAADTHYEILVRMVQEDGSLALPGAFIPAAERFGLMPRVDRWVVDQALAFHAGMGEPDNVPVFFINLSGTSLGSDAFVDFLTQRLADHGAYARRLCFEITETAAIANLAHAAELIESLGRFGCRFALDDFGAGMSSFPYLKNLPVAFLKIEGSFVRAIKPDSMDHALVDAINRVAHHVGVVTIAEHVEDGETLELLRSLGVDYAQGYALGRPALMSEAFRAVKAAH